MSATPISLDDLPRFSRWPGILQGTTPFPQRERTREEVLREYDGEKWGEVLAWLRTQTHVTPEDLLRRQGLGPEQVVAFARGSQFFTAAVSEVMGEYEQLLLKTIRPHQPETLVELGCGLGDKLLKLAKALRPRKIYGGEFTASGVSCGGLLAKHREVIARFEHFDYNDPQTLALVPAGAVVYTSHSIEQIPKLLDSFIEGLIQRSPKLVVHFEPGYEDQADEPVLGPLRRRYAELNDYNRNLVGLLRKFAAAGRIRIREHQKNIFSDTPFNPTSVLTWSPA